MNRSDLSRNNYMLHGPLAKNGYDWWWHSFTGIDEETGEQKPFFVEYYVINPALAPDKVILGQSEENKAKGNLPSYAMLNVGTWGKNKKQLHNFFPLDDCMINPHKLDVRFADNTLTETHMKGKVVVSEEQAADPGYLSDAGEMEFDLTINKQIAFHVGYGASKFFRTLNAFEMFWHAEGMKTLYEGTVVFDGRRYSVKPETSYGYADKNWGKDYTSPWVWFASSNLKSKITGKQLTNSAFDIGGGRPKAFGIPLDRKLLINFNYEGTDYEYNFSKFWTRSKIVFDCYETETEVIWKIKAKNQTSSMKFIGMCKKEDMLKINYEAPNGKKLHENLWNGGNGYGRLKLYDKENNLIDDLVFQNGGCEYGEYSKNR